MSDPIYLELGDDAFVRTFTLDDAPTVFALVDAERERLRRWMPWVDGTATVDDQRRWVERSIASEHDREANGIWLTDGALAGTIGLSVNPLENGGEIGYWLGARYEGRGLVTRACAAMLDLAFDRLELHRVLIRAAVSNVRSRAVAERLGFTEEGVLREAGLVDTGEYLDLVAYGILDREWRERRAEVRR
ncbi:MAG TPA: GNAT family protein [Actinomycetota bacterium]|nr:GNAT family protein [Actinomycetota bacterium]